MGVLDEALAKATCTNCNYWRESDAGTRAIGECRHHSPSSIDAKGWGTWPMTLPEDWCADHTDA
jgi:hypothetical protein